LKQTVLLCIACMLCLTAGNADARIINVPADQGTIQAGIDIAQEGDTVQAADGDYNECLNFGGRAIVVRGNPEFPENVMIDANANGPVVTFDHGERGESVLSGFSLVNGRGQNGGGIALSGTSPTLEHLYIAQCVSNIGGGICISGGGLPTLNDIVLVNNQVELNGAGIAIWRASANMRNVIVIGDPENQSMPIMGGGIYITNGSADMDDVLISGCNADMGGAFSIWNSQVTMDRVLIVGSAAENGAAFYLNGGEVTLRNLTVTVCHAEPSNASAMFTSGTRISITNSIFTEDGDDETPLMIFHDGVVNIDYNDVIGSQDDIVNDQADLTWGEHNIDDDPRFTSVEEADFTLMPDSPCIDAGNPDSPVDSDGSPADLGAFCIYQRDLRYDPEVLEFYRPVQVGSIDSLDVSVYNIGGTTLQMEYPQISPDDGVFMPICEGYDFDDIAPGSHIQFMVYFTPQEARNYRSELWLISNDFHEDTVRVPILASSIMDVDLDPIQGPSSFCIIGLHPNPLNSTTSLHYSLPVAGWTTLSVFSSVGRQVAEIESGWKSAGQQTAIWSAEGLPGGIYVIRLQSAVGARMTKAVLIK